MSNSLAAVHPELVAEWSEKNLPLTPDSISFGSNKKVWWKGACGHEWQTSVKARSNGEKCPICSGARVIAGINDLATLEPLLEKQWSKKNKIKPTEVSIGSHKKVIWRCEKGHEWEVAVKSRTINKTGCPYCSHNKVLAGFNDLATLLPDIAAEWSDRNYPLLPTQVTVFANRKAWWKCKDCGREWNTLISTRSGGSKCPYCSGYIFLKGFNDLQTTHPEIASEWSEKNLSLKPDEVNAKSRKNVWWRCSKCGNEWKSVINARVKGTVYLKELNRFNDPNEVGAGNETDTFKQVIEDPAELIKQMQEVQQVLFNYTTDNAEEFSSEISTIEDKQELLKLKKILIAARDCCNLVRTFGDDELKETFAKMELTKLPSLISEVQHHIDNINQKELFASDDTTKLLVNEAMEDITFNFSKISEEELKIVGGKDAVTEKYKKTVRAFTQNIDPDDPEFITLQEAFLLRFKQHGFEPKSVSEIEEQGKELEDILKKLDELQKKNTVLLRKYNGDAKFARVHKRIREENLARKAANKQPIVSEYDMSIMNVLLSIKSDIDQKVYDRNDILKKDAYFERTVMTQIKAGIDKLGVASAREDRVFIQSRITKQYLDQYNQTYSVA